MPEAQFARKFIASFAFTIESIFFGIATLCLFGMLNWIYTWYDPGKDTPDSLSEQFLGLYLGGSGTEDTGEVEA